MKRRPIILSIYLGWACLIALCIFKVFFPDAFAISVSNPRIILIGNFIDSHTWVEQGLLFLTSYFTFFFYLCACAQSWNLPAKSHIVLTAVTAVLCVIRFVSPSIGMIVDILAMVILPCLFHSTYDQFVVVFALHYVGQILLLLIRSKTVLLIGTDFASQFILSIDAYLWLVLYYLYSNLYKEEPLWEEFVRLFSATAHRKRSKRNSQ